MRAIFTEEIFTSAFSCLLTYFKKFLYLSTTNSNLHSLYVPRLPFHALADFHEKWPQVRRIWGKCRTSLTFLIINKIALSQFIWGLKTIISFIVINFMLVYCRKCLYFHDSVLYLFMCPWSIVQFIWSKIFKQG